MDPFGNLHFSGIDLMIGATFTLSHGITPSSALITTIPQPRLLPDIGTLTFSFRGVRIQFEDCAVDRASLRIGPGGQIWTLRILDRRWKWQFGSISGRYNAREADTTIKAGTERSPKVLAVMLLNAMGETHISTDSSEVGDIPTNTRPFVDWRDANPAQELATLCEQLGCRIVLGTDDRVRIWRIGNGKLLPANGLEMNATFNFDSKIRPDAIKIVAGPTVVESKLLLEAVGLETDGSIQLVDELSYRPAGGWASEHHITFGNVNDFDRPLAKQSVWKWYRVKSQADGSLTVPGDVRTRSYPDGIKLRDERLPVTRNDGLTVSPFARVEGTFYPGGQDEANTAAGTVYDGRFKVDSDRGLVVFDGPVIARGVGNATAEPILFLTTTYTVIDPDTFQEERPFWHQPLGKSRGTGDQVERHDDLFITIKQTYTGVATAGQVVTNAKQFSQDAARLVDQFARQYELDPAGDVQYAGVVPISPDGAIQQVGWTVGYGKPAVTRASRNAEFDRFAPSFAAKRQGERIRDLARKIQNQITAKVTE